MARPTPPGKRTKISVLDVVIVIGGIIGIMAFNRMSIARLQRSLPNANSQIVGEWKSTRGPEHLVFRADRTVSLTVPANLAEGNAAPAAPTNAAPAAPANSAEGNAAQAAPANSAADNAASAAPETSGPAPVTGKYQVVQGGKVGIQLMNGTKYTTTISPGNPNRFDLVDSATEGVTTFERVPAAPASAGTTPQVPSH